MTISIQAQATHATTYKAPSPRDVDLSVGDIKTTLHNTQARRYARHNAQRHTSMLKILEPELRKLTNVDLAVSVSKRP